MDGTERNEVRWIAGEDPYMLVFPLVSLCRGRPSKPDTLVAASFTRKQLDAVAPLSRSDVLSMRLSNPSARAKRMIQNRIEEAFNLKYRTTDVK